MILKDISFPTPQENILYDDVLLQIAERDGGEEVLRFWESSEIFIVLGRIGKKEQDINSLAVNQDSVKVFRRSSGGGTVVQGPGCLNYSLILSKENHPGLNDINKSYQYILSKVITVLKALKIDCQFFPISDIATSTDQKKISGNAQKRSRNFILHHGTILYNFDLALIDKYLNMPNDKPLYRQNRGHLDFVTNIEIDKNVFKEQLVNTWKITQQREQIEDRERSVLLEMIAHNSIAVS